MLVLCLYNVARQVIFLRILPKSITEKIEVWKEGKGERNYTAEMARISRTGNIDDLLPL